LVYAIAQGTASITASTKNGKTASCVVTVEPIPVASVKLLYNELRMEVDEDYVLSVKEVMPANATDKTIIWLSDNNAVATVTDGYILAIAVGTATIRAIAHNGVEDTCIVTVVVEP